MITLVLGGTRSGKSALAERIAAVAAREWREQADRATGAEVLYLATAQVDPADADHVERVGVHRARRPRGWRTVECDGPRLVPALEDATGVVLLDSLGSWLAGQHDFVADTDALVAVLTRRTAPTVVVAEEVGLAIHPVSALGRRYVDAVGLLNQRVAAVAGRVLLVVAGRAIELPASDR